MEVFFFFFFLGGGGGGRGFWGRERQGGFMEREGGLKN